MTQKKKTAHKKTHKKSHSNKYNAKIIYQTMPNYSSSQLKGHQNNNNVQFGPQPQQESRTDNLVGDLISKLVGKIENDGNKQTQEYTKEIQPINNNNNVNIYNNVPGTTTTETDKKTTDETPVSDSKPESKISDTISNGVRTAARSAAEEFALQAGAGLTSIAAAAFGTAGWRNRKAIRNSLSSFPANAKNRLSSISERFRNPRAYSQFEDVISPSVGRSPAASVAGSPAASVAGSPAASNASSTGENIIDSLSQSVGITPARTRTASSAPRQRINSASSENYADLFVPENLGEQFSNVKTPAPRRPALNSEQREFLQRTLRSQNLDPSHLSPVNQDILRGGFSSSPRRSARLSGIQEHTGVSTRSIRAETGEAHTQLQTPLRRASEQSPKLSDLKPLPAKRGRKPRSGTPKPMRVTYDRPGRPPLIQDPMEPDATSAPKLRIPKKK